MSENKSKKNNALFIFSIFWFLCAALGFIPSVYYLTKSFGLFLLFTLFPAVGVFSLGIILYKKKGSHAAFIYALLLATPFALLFLGTFIFVGLISFICTGGFGILGH